MVEEKSNNVETLSDEAIEWLKKNYHKEGPFFAERDIVWTIQKHLIEQIQGKNQTLKVYNDYPIIKGRRRHKTVDLAILNNGICQLALEVKYEPLHDREEWKNFKGRIPVVSWGKDGVLGDIKRIETCLEKKKALIAYAIFIDEGGYYKKNKDAPKGSEWKEWVDNGWLLITKSAKILKEET